MTLISSSRTSVGLKVRSIASQTMRRNISRSPNRLWRIPSKTKKVSGLILNEILDSLTALSSWHLDRLVTNLPEEALKNLSNFYEGEEINLFKRKGVFRDEWFDGFEKLNETQLPSKEDFYSKHNDTDITEEDYQHAQKVWKTVEMETMRDYHDIYLETDVLLLANVFENFRDVCERNYGLNLAWYYTAPGLALDACLKYM